ncbi:uncharacterized protein LOC123519630 [Portunus trituberculatus]|uniref:uncharacterized protein LOC123519630 n=1 Tax=Portunus trituberculatus TaxID=210409 RepID=UPI001E1CB104|nr:uncharacterized protein LOC123519630 [Portunus trituberculatus]XP_045137007.1 uncharacterized protein LOC123519630 [Portunus trituberculatus]XP_045137008.1 uncharacterized protein LOC123519630 [Portunus trituberculatus]
MSSCWAVLVAWLTLFLLVHPSASFFIGIDTSVEEADGYEIINPLDSWFLGGGTSIVYNALTFNIFGIKEKLREWYFAIASTAFFEGTALIISGIASIVSAVVTVVTEIISTITSNIIETSWRKKLAFLEFLFRIATGRSLNGAVEFARAITEVDRDAER